MLKLYHYIGAKLADSWGVKVEVEDEYIRSMSASEEQKCLLATVASRLGDILHELRTPNRSISDPVSEGQLEAIRAARLGPQIPENLQGLSLRARRVLRRSGIKYVRQITKHRLVALEECGPVTAREIMAWVSSAVGVSLKDVD